MSTLICPDPPQSAASLMLSLTLTDRLVPDGRRSVRHWEAELHDLGERTIGRVGIFEYDPMKAGSTEDYLIEMDSASETAIEVAQHIVSTIGEPDPDPMLIIDHASLGREWRGTGLGRYVVARALAEVAASREFTAWVWPAPMDGDPDAPLDSGQHRQASDRIASTYEEIGFERETDHLWSARVNPTPPVADVMAGLDLIRQRWEQDAL